MRTYTASQQAAIDELDRPLQLIACSASGKSDNWNQPMTGTSWWLRRASIP